jgi:hypothetical protein
MKKRTGYQSKRIAVSIEQISSARTGQGGNPIAINASDVGVVRSDVKTITKK